MHFSPDDPPTGTEFIEQTLADPITSEESMLRPLSFADFAGQDKTIERLQVMVGAARDRDEPLNHILLSGPPGLGKTTLSLILGHEMGKQVSITSGPVIDKPADLAGLTPTSAKATSCLLMRFAASPKPSKSISTPRWKTSASTS